MRAYILKGMPATQLLTVALWARRSGKLLRIVDDADGDRRAPNAKRLGELIDFSFDELKAIKHDDGYSVRHVDPFDAQRWQVKAFWKAERQMTDRERKQRARKKEQTTMPTLTKRATLVHKAMSGTRWTSVSAIMDAVVLRGQRNRRLAPPALRRAINRALDELVACGLAEAKIEGGERGRTAIRLARRAHVCGQVSVSSDNVSGDKNASADVATQ